MDWETEHKHSEQAELGHNILADVKVRGLSSEEVHSIWAAVQEKLRMPGLGIGIHTLKKALPPSSL